MTSETTDNEECSTLGTIGDIILMDGSQYLGITKAGIQSAVSVHVLFTTDELTYRFVMRVDGQPLWASSLVPYKDSSSSRPVSPYVTLATRS